MTVGVGLVELELTQTLRMIAACDTAEPPDYEKRYPLVFRALSLALSAGFEAGVRMDPNEPEWPVVYIELPTGQVSWHSPQHGKPWDGHSTGEKYLRVWRYCDDARIGRKGT